MIDIRDACAADAAAINALMNHEAREGLALWSSATQSDAERAAWIAARQARFAVLVAEGPDFAGYASYGPFRDKEGYRLTVEHSVYVTAQARGRGVARALMGALIGRARAQGFHVMVGAVEAGNVASLALHDSLGFARVGVMPQAGTKFGRWLDLALVQLVLDDGAAPG